MQTLLQSVIVFKYEIALNQTLASAGKRGAEVDIRKSIISYAAIKKNKTLMGFDEDEVKAE